MLFPSHFVLCPVCHVFLSIIETSSNMVKVSKGIKLKMTEKTDLELRTRAVCISLLPPCFSMFPLCTLNFYLNLWKKKGMYTKRCKFSATQTAIFCHLSKKNPSILQCGGIKFLRNFSSNPCPLCTSTHSPAVGQ